jgi:hypothetical protein
MHTSKKLTVAAAVVFAIIMAANSNHVFADVPYINDNAESYQPRSGCCSSKVTILGGNFGFEHDDLGFPLRQVRIVARVDVINWFAFHPGGTVQDMLYGPEASQQVYNAPIFLWSDDHIEFEVECGKWNPDSPYYSDWPMTLYFLVTTENGISAARVFSLFDCSDPHSMVHINPDYGPCKSVLLLQNPNGDFGNAQTETIEPDLPTAVTRIVDFVASAGRYTALNYGSDITSGTYAWTNTEIPVEFKDFYQDSWERNYVQDGDEPSKSLCEGMAWGKYNVYIQHIFFRDENRNVALDLGEQIFQVVHSRPKVFELTKGSADCECSLDPYATEIHRGETLGFQATVANNRDGSATVYFATNITLPEGGVYPASGFLNGPFRLLVDPYGSVSGPLSFPIPVYAPLGTYFYRGYVGNSGVIYETCEFEFEVTPEVMP